MIAQSRDEARCAEGGGTYQPDSAEGPDSGEGADVVAGPDAGRIKEILAVTQKAEMLYPVCVRAGERCAEVTSIS